MRKERILVWGNGNALRKNICWIKQLYFIVGITESNMELSVQKRGELLYPPARALQLQYDFILVVSQYFG